MSAKAKIFRRHEERPLTPADCLRSGCGHCQKCGTEAQQLHSPTRHVRGLFCAGCCPACTSAEAQRMGGICDTRQKNSGALT
jgi:hypothetical protein